MKRPGAFSVLVVAALAACGGSTTSGTGGTERCATGNCGGVGPGGMGGAAHSGGSENGGQSTGGLSPRGGAGGVSTDAGAGGSPVPGCTYSNGGVEICDGVDNDCDGLVDEPKTKTDVTGVDFADLQTCGNCTTNCLLQIQFATAPTCYPPTPTDGVTPGSCGYDRCADGYYDIDFDATNGCEYACPWNPDRSVLRDLGGPDGCGIDDDCNGLVDDGLEFCDDVQNCGGCGRTCDLPNTDVTRCVTQADAGATCDSTNTHCDVVTCKAGWSNPNGAPDDGCEQGPPPGAPGPEVCDGIDNDGDGNVDEAGAPPNGIDGTANPGDPTLHIGDACGSNVGECKTGAWSCSGGQFVCSGALTPKREICDGKDNDCDGAVDDIPVNGALCATNSECVQADAATFECAIKCKYSEFKCPLGLTCALVESSTHPGQSGQFCIR